WDVASGAERAAIRDLPGIVMSVRFSPDGRLLVFSAGSQLVVCDAATLEQLATGQASENDIWNVAISPDGRRVATAGSDGVVRVWDAATARELAHATPHTDAAFGVAFSPDGSLVASSSNDGTVKLLAPDTLAE